MGIGTNLKRHLALQGKTLKTLAAETNIPLNTLYSLTRRDSGSTRSDYLTRIAEALDIEIEELIDPRKVLVIHGPNALKQPEAEVFNCTGKEITAADIEELAGKLTQESRERLLAYALELAELEQLRAKFSETESR